MPNYPAHPSSYRDPSGFIFQVEDVYHRQVNQVYGEEYELLVRSGLYSTLTEKGLLITHQEIDKNLTGSEDWYKTLLPLQIAVISHPCEWSSAQLKDAALHTLKIQRIAMDYGMSLKDATPFNIQFQENKPLFIDSLSFEKYDAARPWVAYRQFCESFLFPLYLQHYLKTGLGPITSAYPGGIPAAVTARLLPFKSRLNPGAWIHLFLQKNIRSDLLPGGRQISFSKTRLRNILDHLSNITARLAPGGKSDPSRSEWSDYYGKTILSREYLEAKEKIFMELIGDISFGTALDLGANNGRFSILLSKKGAAVIAIDSDWQCIDNLYHHTREKGIDNILPLCLDLANPTPATGFRNAERATFTSRCAAELVAALALVHHLVLGKNIPMEGVACYFAELTRVYLIIEFVPLSDEKTQELVRNKSRWHTPYTVAFFEHCFSARFIIERKESIPGTERILYRMKRKDFQA